MLVVYCFGSGLELTPERFKTLVSSKCVYCGQNSDKSKNNFNGVDRRQNNIGYTVENSVTCCKECNFAKGSIPESEFLDWIKRVVKFHNVKNI